MTELVDDGHRFAIVERMRFGVASAPFDDAALSEAKGQSLSFVTDVVYRIDDFGWVGLRVPLVVGSVAQPVGSYVDEAAWGNPELRAAVPIPIDDTVRFTVGGGVGAPLAEHASSLQPDRVLAIANGVEGFAEPELFRPRRLPLTPFGAIDIERGRWQLGGLLKLLVLAGVQERGVSVAMVAQARGSVSITRAFGLALAPQLVISGEPAQFLIGGGPFFRIARWGSIRVEVEAPIGGALGGSTVGVGLWLGVSL